MKLSWNELDKIRTVDRLDKLVAVPPDLTAPVTRSIDPQVVLKDASVPPEADPFIEAGWTFVPQEATGPDVDARAVYLDNSGRMYIDGRRLTVRFSPTLSRERIEEMLAQHGLVLKRELGFAPNAFVVAPAEPDPAHAGIVKADIVKIAGEMGQEPEVDFASPSFIEALSGR